VARILIVAGGCRGRALAAELIAQGHIVRVSTRSEERRQAIEATGAECWVGTPDRLATMRGALDGATVLCWLLGTAAGPAEQLRELHTSRLRFFLTQAIDTTVRGIVYEARAGATPAAPAADRVERVVGGEHVVGRERVVGGEHVAGRERVVGREQVAGGEQVVGREQVAGGEQVVGREQVAGACTSPALLADGERIARELTARNAIPAVFLTADPRDVPAWVANARAAIAALLAPA
jgi:hypothetical protein